MRFRAAVVVVSLALVGATALVPAGAQPSAQTSQRDGVQQTDSETWIVTLQARGRGEQDRLAAGVGARRQGAACLPCRLQRVLVHRVGTGRGWSSATPTCSRSPRPAEFRLQSDGVPDGHPSHRRLADAHREPTAARHNARRTAGAGPRGRSSTAASIPTTLSCSRWLARDELRSR